LVVASTISSKKKEIIQIGKKVKLSLFANDIALHGENPKKPLKINH
jgi:hypothetical protein